MGQYDIFVYGGLAAAAGYFIITNPDLINGLFPPANGETTEPPVEDGNGNGGDGDGGNGNGGDGNGGSYDCKKACTNCWCKSYSEKCSGGCSRCSGANRVASKCGGQGSEPSGKFGEVSGGSTSKSEDCRNFCNKGWCESYRKRGCTGGCVTCIKGGIAQPSGSGCPSKVISSNCAGNCRSTCWHGRAGSIVRDVCVSKSISGCNSVSCSACQAARSAFLKKYSSNLAYAFNTSRMSGNFPYNEQRITLA